MRLTLHDELERTLHIDRLLIREATPPRKQEYEKNENDPCQLQCQKSGLEA